MSVIIIGKNGQLAYELAKTQPDSIEAFFFDSQALDIRNKNQINDILGKLKPTTVINAAAYTAVDAAESDLDNAYAVNAKGAGYLAKVCDDIDARLIHISTDFVFGTSKNTPYKINDETNPQNVYGASKLAGELAIATNLPMNSVIIRTSWMYSSHGSNFVKTMLRLMTEKPELSIVSNQIGSPTWAKGLAKACWHFVSNTEVGIYHYSDLGVASWYDLAVAIQEIGLEKGLLNNTIPIKPIKAECYPTPASRAAYSVMDTDQTYRILGVSGMHWRSALKRMMSEL